MKPVPKNIWITKYALTRGILKYDETSPATFNMTKEMIAFL